MAGCVPSGKATGGMATSGHMGRMSASCVISGKATGGPATLVISGEPLSPQ